MPIAAPARLVCFHVDAFARDFKEHSPPILGSKDNACLGRGKRQACGRFRKLSRKYRKVKRWTGLLRCTPRASDARFGESVPFESAVNTVLHVDEGIVRVL